jgi:EAL domain-containing protein (putative c-di-GMP-specific phosphodiesterase class I)
MNPKRNPRPYYMQPIVESARGAFIGYEPLTRQHEYIESEHILFPYFQPIVGAASGTIVGYEALARQYDNFGRVMSAGELFSSPDISADQLIAWDRTVRRQALEQFSRSNFNGYLTINISAAWIDYLADFNSLPTLLMLQEFNVDTSRIIIEITESNCNLDKLVEIARIYRRNGLKIAIDDFGAGFSQLERVIAIQPNIIKLDMRLFQNAAKGGIAGDVVHLISRLAKRTGCRIVCEGVETVEDFHFGLSCGAQYMQGYLFSPATAEFKDPRHYQQQIGLLRKSFLNKTVAKEKLKIQFIANIKSLIERLKKILEADFSVNELPVSPFEGSGVLRFYLCNNEGDQISSNFNFDDGKWIEDASQLGFNWAWRPYFYQLLAFEFENNTDRLVTSERYRDFNTDIFCKTLSLRLEDGRVLLIDIAAEWI